MELKNLFKNILKNKLLLTVFVLIGGIFCLFYTLLPSKYYATGSFLITRKVNPAEKDFFTYEGYYGQQTALSFTKTVAALFESEDVFNRALKKMNINIDETSLRKLSKKIRVTNPGPQLVTLQIKENTQSNAVKNWEAVSESAIEITNEANKNGDSLLGISKLSAEPIVKGQYKPVALMVLSGMVAGFCIYVVFFYLKEYIK